MEKIEGMQSRRGDILRNSITLGQRASYQTRQIRSQEHQPVLVGAVVRAGAVLVFPAVLVPGWQAVFMAVVASGTVAVPLSAYSGIDKTGIETVYLAFPAGSKGTLLIDNLEWFRE